MSDNTPSLPDASGEMKPEGKRPTAKQLEARGAELEQRQIELDEREQDVLAREQAAFDGSLPDRTSIDEAVKQDEHDDFNPKAIRRQMQQGKKLADTQVYEEKYQEQQLLWVNDLSGDVQRWIDVGAEPVPTLSRSSKVFEGITDKVESKWVRSVGGDDGMGGHYWVYLMVIDSDLYEEVKIQPIKDRQELIRRAMKLGMDTSDIIGGPKLPTYAPNLPTGDRGLDITRETVAPPER